MTIRELHGQWRAETKESISCGMYVRTKSFEQWLFERLTAAEERLDETYTDEDGNVWTLPTPWAYAQACKALKAAKRAIVLLQDGGNRAALEPLRRLNELDNAEPPQTR